MLVLIVLLLELRKTAYRILSGFGRINYNYNMKYLLSFTARYDGISRLKDNRWGVFPAFSAGWRISEEAFIKDNVDWLSNLKLRLGWGKTR